MARLPRLAVGGEVHYAVQSGHNGCAVFVDAEDRGTYLELLRAAASAERVAVHGFALLDCEVHLLATPATADGLSRFMQALGRGHGARFNRRHGRVGTLWAGRFRAAVVDPDGWVLKCLHCIEQLLVPSSPWSSAPHHLGALHQPLIAEHPAYWALGNTPFEREVAWRRLMDQPLPEAELTSIGRAVRGGWPIGSERFRRRLAQSVDRRLAPASPGRPPASREPVPDIERSAKEGSIK